MADQEHQIQINTEAQSWVEQVNRELNQLTQKRSMEEEVWQGESIYRIPWNLKKLCNNAYHPQTASIGPYHHGTKNLKAMEKHKHRALLNFLHRNKKPLQCYVDALEKKVGNLMAAYDQMQPKWKQNKDAFLQLMILDGIFILELMQTHRKSNDGLKEMGYSTNDPVFSRHGQLYFGPFLRRDMLMLENQIPMQVLCIILLVAGAGHEIKLIGWIKTFFCHTDNQSSEDCWIKKLFCPRHSTTSFDQSSEGCLHILDLYRKSLLLKTQNSQDSESQETEIPTNQNLKKSKSLWRKICSSEEEPYIRSATELEDAGIRFEKSETTKLNDISFKCGALKLPAIEVDDAWESEYLNMMAFERFHSKAGSEVTSYVFLMDRLIDSDKDVRLLHWRRIVRNSLGSDQAVATLFNSLSMETCLDLDNSLYEVQKKVTKYYRSPMRRCMAYAKHTYFTNAWVALSLIAAFFLFALTIIQTLYAILDYYKK